MRTRRNRAEWARDVRKWQRSGLTARAYGELTGRPYRQLRWWKWKLGLGGEARRTQSVLVRPSQPPVPAGRVEVPVFVEARVVPERAAGLAALPTVDIVVSSCRTVRVGAGFDEGLVLRVVRLLEREP